MVAHIEDFFELRVMRKHTVVEVGGQFRSCFNQRGMVAFSDGFVRQAYVLQHVKI